MKPPRRSAYIHTTESKTSYCPVCISIHQAVTGVGFAGHKRPRPKPGDYTMCADCGALLKLDDQMNERTVPPQEETEYLSQLEEVPKRLLLGWRERLRNKSL